MSWHVLLHYISVIQTEVELNNSMTMIAVRTLALSLSLSLSLSFPHSLFFPLSLSFISMSNPSLSLWPAGDWRLDQSSLCHPCVHAQALDRRALPVLRASRGSAQPQRGVEVWPVVLAITAIIWATRRAEAVGRWTSQNFLSAGPLLRLLWGEPRRGDALPWRWDRLRLDVYALAGADR